MHVFGETLNHFVGLHIFVELKSGSRLAEGQFAALGTAGDGPQLDADLLFQPLIFHSVAPIQGFGLLIEQPDEPPFLLQLIP